MNKEKLAIQYGFFENIYLFDEMIAINNKISNVNLLDMKFHNLIIKERDQLIWQRILSNKTNNKEEVLDNLYIMLNSFSAIIFEKIKATIIVQLLSNNEAPKILDDNIKQKLFNTLYTYIHLLKDKSSILYNKSKFNYDNYDFKLFEDNSINDSSIPNKNREYIFEKIYEIKKDNLQPIIKQSNDIVNSISARFYLKFNKKESIDDLLSQSRNIMINITKYFSILENVLTANLFELNLTLKEILTIVENFITNEIN